MKVVASVKNNWKKQVEFIYSNHTHPCLISGYGFGKTNAIPKRFARIWTDLIRKGEKNIVLFNVGLKAAINENVIRPEFEKFFDKYKIRYRWIADKTKSRYEIKFNGAEIIILILSAERPDKIVGFNAHGGNIDEFDVVLANKQYELWKNCLARTRMGENPTLSITTTPEGFKYAYYLCVRSAFETFSGEKLEKEIKPIGKYIRAKTSDNTALSNKFIDNLRRSLDPKRFIAYTEGIFKNFAIGQVFNYWDDTYIVDKDHKKEFGSYFTFWDFGISNPTYVGFGIVDAENVYIYDEVMVTNKVINEIIEEDVLPIRHSNTIGDYCDPAGNARDGTSGYGETKVMRSYDLRVKYMQSQIVDRIFIMNVLMSKGKIKVHSKCKHLIDTFVNSVYPDPINGIYDERPVKDGKLDHARDAVGYFFVNYFNYKLRESQKNRAS